MPNKVTMFHMKRLHFLWNYDSPWLGALEETNTITSVNKPFHVNCCPTLLAIEFKVIILCKLALYNQKQPKMDPNVRGVRHFCRVENAMCTE